MSLLPKAETMVLTDTAIGNCKPGETVYKLADGRGSQLRLTHFKARSCGALPIASTASRSDGKGLPRLLRKIDVNSGSTITRVAIKLMAMTFVRTSELIGARWNEFDLDAARWDIPAGRMNKEEPAQRAASHASSHAAEKPAHIGDLSTYQSKP